MHRRTAILTEIETRLRAIAAFAGAGKVARWRTAPIPEERLPALTVTWADADERADPRPNSAANGGLAYMRALPVSVIVHFRGTNPADAFDELCESIEAAMAADHTLGGRVTDCLLTASRLFVDPDTGLPVAAGRLTYLVTYTTAAADPAQAAL